MASGPQDQPDYVRFNQQASTLVFRNNAIAVPSTVGQTLGTFYVGNLSGLFVLFRVSGSANLVELDLNFYNDDAAAFPFDEQSLMAGLGAGVATFAPVKGSWVQPVITGVSPFFAATVAQVAIIGVSGVFEPWQMHNQFDLCAASVAGVAAGTFGAPVLNPLTTPGRWIAQLSSTLNLSLLLVQQQLSNGIWTTVGRGQDTNGSGITLPVNLWARPTQLIPGNLGAGPATFNLTLVPG